MKNYDSIVIGAGVNGLVTAGYLAKAGQSVLVLERRDVIGGMAVTEEFAPGFRCNPVVDYLRWFHPGVMKELNLTRHGLRIDRVRSTVVAPHPDGRPLVLSQDTAATAESIRQFSSSDASEWPAFTEYVSRLASFLEALNSITPPPAPKLSLKDLMAMRGMFGPMRKFGRKSVVELLRVLPMMMLEFLDEWFESDILRGALSAAGISGIRQGPMSAGTVYLFLQNHVGVRSGTIRPTGFVQAGIGQLTKALAEAASQVGADIRTESEVAQIVSTDGRTAGVVLANGEELSAIRVISSLDPKRTFLDQVGLQNLEPKFIRKVRNIKIQGAVARVHFALSGLPSFNSVPKSDLVGVISISPSLEYLERAYDASKYGRLSSQPYLEVTIPSLREPAMAPAGKHVMSVTLQYAPYHLREGDWGIRRDEVAHLVADVLDQYAPRLSNMVEATQVLTPVDLERTFGLTEGNVNHGEMMLDQFFFMRPVSGYARYRTPIRNLYLCGSGTHPGGGLTGANGFNAAREILKDVGEKR